MGACLERAVSGFSHDTSQWSDQAAAATPHFQDVFPFLPSSSTSSCSVLFDCFFLITCFSHASLVALGVVNWLTTLVQNKISYWMDWQQSLYISLWLWLSHLKSDIYDCKRNVSTTSPLDGSPWKLVQTFKFPSGWIVITFLPASYQNCPVLLFMSKYQHS